MPAGSVVRKRRPLVERPLRQGSVTNKGVKGRIVYRNFAAMPVGSKKNFSIKNVEWLSARKQIGEGASSSVHWGKVKLKGKPSPKRVIIKTYFENLKETQIRRLNAVLKRLKQSRVSQLKMSLARIKPEGSGSPVDYMLMEPFLKKGKTNSMISKLQATYFGDAIRELNLKKQKDLSVFRQAIKQTALLARNGLFIGHAADQYGKRADVFNFIKLKNGKRTVFLQDIDTLELGSSSQKNWQKSANQLIEAVSALNQKNRVIAQGLINATAKKSGFS